MNAFDPTDWLVRFEAAGGCWHVSDDKPMLCTIRGANLGDILLELHMPARTEAVGTLICDRHARKQVWVPAE